MDLLGLEPYLPQAPMRSEMSPEQALLLKQALENKAKVQQMAKPQAPVVVPVDNLDVGGLDREYAQLRDMLQAKVGDSIGQQKAGVKQLEQGLQDIRSRHRDVDFSALASYFDSTVPGSKLSQGYRAPESEAERQQKILMLEDAIQKQRQGVTNQEIDSMKSLLNTHMYNKAIQAQGRQARFDTAQNKSAFDTARKEQGKLVKDSAEFTQNISSVKAALNPDKDGKIDLARLKQVIPRFVRIMGETGPLSEGDQGRAFGATIDSQLADLERYASGTGKVDSATAQAIVGSIADAEMAFNQKYKQMADSFADTYFNNPGSPYANREWAPKMVEDIYKPLKEKPSQEPKKDLNSMSIEELEKRAKELGL